MLFRSPAARVYYAAEGVNRCGILNRQGYCWRTTVGGESALTSRVLLGPGGNTVHASSRFRRAVGQKLRQYEFANSRHELRSPPRMKICYNSSNPAGTEVALIIGATSLSNSRTRTPVGTANCAPEHAGQYLTIWVSTPAGTSCPGGEHGNYSRTLRGFGCS